MRAAIAAGVSEREGEYSCYVSVGRGFWHPLSLLELVIVVLRVAWVLLKLLLSKPKMALAPEHLRPKGIIRVDGTIMPGHQQHYDHWRR